MKRFAPLASLALPLALIACAESVDENRNDTEETDLDIATTDGEAAAMAQAVEAGDFASLTLGPKVIGPQGTEPVTRLLTPEGAFADMRSYVACPADMELCDPETAPEGTVYTYVHTVFPGEDNDPNTGSGEGADSSDIEVANAFKMTRPAHGFTGQVGYSQAELAAAAGRDAIMIVTCGAEGQLVWTVDTGDGGDQWEQAEPITFWWQSTVPPAGPQEAYAIQANRTTASGPGPFPNASDTATNACLAPEENGS